MDNDFSEKLKAVLSDPDAMAKIMTIASGLGLSESQDKAESTPVSTPEKASERENSQDSAAMLPAVPQVAEQQSDPRLALLASLKPLVREEKRERLDALTRALTLATMMKSFRK